MTDTLLGLVEGPMAVRTSEGVAHVMRKAIISGRLAPGEVLAERKLAEELSVSRTPVREALFILQGEGLIELAAGKRARVREVSSTEIQEIFVLRRMLETHAAEQAAVLADKAKLARIVDALRVQRILGEASNALEQAQADLAFHEAIANAAGSQLLLTLLRQVLAITVTYRSAIKYTGARVTRVYQEHDGILEAIRAGDAKLAGERMSQHVAASSDAVIRAVVKDGHPYAQPSATTVL